MEFSERKTIIIYHTADGVEHKCEIADNPIISVEEILIEGKRYVRGRDGQFVLATTI